MLFFISCLSIAVAAQSDDAGGVDTAWMNELPIVSLVPGKDAPYLRPFIRFQTGYEGKLEFAEVVRATKNLKKIDLSRIQFGSSSKPILVMVRVKNEGIRPGKWVFSTDRNSLEHIKLFEINRNNLFETYSDSSLEEKRLNWNRYSSYASEIYMLPGREKVIGVYFADTSSTYMNLSIKTEDNLSALIGRQAVMMALVAGCIFALVFFNGVMLVMTRRSVFLYITIAELLFLYQSIYMAGYASIYIFSDARMLGQLSSEFAKCLFVIFTMQFARVFMRTEISFPRFDRLLKLTIVVSFLIIMLLITVPYFGEKMRVIATYAAWGVTGLSSLILPVVAMEASKRYGSVYIPLVIAFSILGLFISYTVLATFNIFPTLPDHWRWFGPVGLVEAMLITIALGLDLKKIQENSVDTQLQLNESLRDALDASRRARNLAQEKAEAYANLNDQSSLIHAAGHDSKQIIVALNTATQFLERAKIDQVPEQIINMLKSASSHLSGVISTTLASASTIGHTTKMLALGYKSLDQLMSSIEMIFAPMANQKNLKLIVLGRADRSFVSDFTLLYRIIANLVSNAIKFTSSGTIVIAIRYAKDSIRFQVKDSGGGITPDGVEQLSKILNTRYREDEYIEGSGTGYRSCQSIAERLGGGLHISSEIGSGSTIEVRLPIQPVQTDQQKLFLVPAVQLDAIRAQINFSAQITTKYIEGVSAVLIDLDTVFGSSRDNVIRRMSVGVNDVPVIGLTSDVSITMREWAEGHLDGILYKPVRSELFDIDLFTQKK